MHLQQDIGTTIMNVINPGTNANGVVGTENFRDQIIDLQTRLKKYFPLVKPVFLVLLKVKIQRSLSFPIGLT